MRRLPFFLLFILLLISLFNYGQDPYDFKFKTYTYNDGLVHNYTKKCQQDSKGFLWIITQHGLSRFDGIHFKNFEHNPADSNSLPQDDLEDIAIDANDRIWLSYKKGLCYYDQTKHRFVKIYSGKKVYESHSVLFDKKRNCVWTVNISNFAKIDCNSKRIDEYAFKIKQSPREYINRLFLDSRDRLWIPYLRNRYRCIHLSDFSEYLHTKNLESMSFYEDDSSNIWMCTWQDGIRRVTVTDSIHEHKVYGNPFIQIDEEHAFISTGIASSKTLGGNNILWISLSTEGILLFDRSAGKVIRQLRYDANNKNGTSTDFNENIFTDRDDNIWLCTWHGITKVNAKEQQFNSRELPELKSELYNCVSGIADDPSDKNTYWLAAIGSGILKYDRSTSKVKEYCYYYYNSATKIFTGEDLNYDWRWTSNLYKDHYDQLWSTTYAGLIKIKNGQPSKVMLTDNDGRILYPQHSKELLGNIWVTGETGIFKVNPLDNSYRYYADIADKKNIFHDIEILDSNRLLVAGNTGIQVFNIKNESFSPFPMEMKKVMNIELIGNNVYAGGINGLAVYNLSTRKTTFVGKEQGIEMVLQNRLKKDPENNLWIFTSHGLFRYYTQKKYFEEFTTKDGIYDLSDDHINFFSYNNRFYIGYRMATTSFDPLKVNVNTKKVEPIITEIFINNQLLSFSLDSLTKSGLHLKYDENGIRINYTAPDFTNTDKIIFSYQLEGFDTAWTNAGARRSVVFTNLEPGKYVFRLKAANSNGIWNEKITSLSFTIKTPFWKTAWFRISMLALLAGLVYLLYRYRLRQIKKIYEVRSDISRSLHDEVGATLSSINIYSEVARNKTMDHAVKSLLDKVYDASANAMENMSDIVWYVNPNNDLVENLLVRMREYALPLLEAKGINVVFDAREHIEDIKTTMSQRHNMYLIFKEAVNNALKYSGAKNIVIILEKNERLVMMQVKDDGKGFTAGKNFSGNGIKNMYFRAKVISGKLDIIAEEGIGTSIRLQFPIA